MSARARALTSEIVSAVQNLDPLAQPRAERRGHRQRSGRPHGRVPLEVRRERAERAQQHPQPGAILAGERKQLHAVAPAAALGHVGAGEDHLVLAREVALDQIAGGAVARNPRVEAAEQQPRQRPGQLGREQALGGGVKARHIQGAGMAQRDAGRARRERLVDVDDIDRQLAERLLDRPRDVHRQRRRPAPRRGEREHLADAEHHWSGGGALEQRLGFAAERPTSVPDEGCRFRGRHDQHPVSPLGELLGDSGHVGIDLTVHLPGERRHLHDREVLGHGD